MDMEEIYDEFPFLRGEKVLVEELEDYYYALLDKRTEAFNSYNLKEQVCYCKICKEPLIKGSMAYDHGYHFDSCI